MKVLELWDVTGDKPVRMGSSAVFTPNGIKYEGTDAVRDIIERLPGQNADSVFNRWNGWSNGYIALRSKGGE